MNQTFTKLATEFDEALQRYRICEEWVADAKANVIKCEADRDNAAEEMRRIRDQLLAEYPELAPAHGSAKSVREATDEWQPPGPGAFTPIEVDDPDDVPDFRERR